MRVHFKAMASYGSDNLASQASVANSVALIQMLFDGFIESINAAKGVEIGAGFDSVVQPGEAVVRGVGPAR